MTKAYFEGLPKISDCQNYAVTSVTSVTFCSNAIKNKKLGTNLTLQNPDFSPVTSVTKIREESANTTLEKVTEVSTEIEAFVTLTAVEKTNIISNLIYLLQKLQRLQQKITEFKINQCSWQQQVKQLCQPILTLDECDWRLLCDNEAAIKAFAEALVTMHQREHGTIPEHYTSLIRCKGCGIVPISPDIACSTQAKVLGCPWCFNRIKNLPMPSSARGMV